jgi:hypothetical protein
MKCLHLLRSFTPVTVVIILFLTACDKDADQNSSAGEGGYSQVKIVNGGTPATIQQAGVRYENRPATILIAEIRRDMVALDRTMTVMIRNDNSLVTAANPAFHVLPDSLYTVNAGVSISGGYYKVIFLPGEFAKKIHITINNPTLLNPRGKYAVGLTIESADANGSIAVQRSIVTQIQTANRWDGIYKNIGNPAAPDHGFRDVTNPAYVWFRDQEYSLVTVSPDQCIVFNIEQVMNGPSNLPNYWFFNTSFEASYASYGLMIKFDSVTNKIISVHNAWADLDHAWFWPFLHDPFCIMQAPLYATCNTRRAILDPSGANEILPNRDIVIKHFMLQPSVVPTPPSIRSYFDETWKYIRPR